jgi:prephenate dehydrogenase
MAVQITLVGLGKIGTSIGLALVEHKDLVRRVGHDPELSVARQAEKLGALDQVSINLPAAVRQADIVVLDLPVDLLRKTLEVIARDLKEGAVVIDTSPVKTAVAGWIAELFPPKCYFMAWMTALNPAYLHESDSGIETAHADLFRNSLVFVTTPPGTATQAVKLGTDLVTLLGATPLFADPEEVEGLLATSRILPQLLAAALVNATVDKPGWREARKLAGSSFHQAASPLLALDESEDFGQAALLNQQNTLRVIDDVLISLRELRQIIAGQDVDALKKQLRSAREGLLTWQKQRQAGEWDGEIVSRPEMPSAGSVFSHLLFGKIPGSKNRKPGQ